MQQNKIRFLKCFFKFLSYIKIMFLHFYTVVRFNTIIKGMHSCFGEGRNRSGTFYLYVYYQDQLPMETDIFSEANAHDINVSQQRL